MITRVIRVIEIEYTFITIYNIFSNIRFTFKASHLSTLAVCLLVFYYIMDSYYRFLNFV